MMPYDGPMNNGGMPNNMMMGMNDGGMPNNMMMNMNPNFCMPNNMMMMMMNQGMNPGMPNNMMGCGMNEFGMQNNMMMMMNNMGMNPMGQGMGEFGMQNNMMGMNNMGMMQNTMMGMQERTRSPSPRRRESNRSPHRDRIRSRSPPREDRKSDRGRSPNIRESHRTPPRSIEPSRTDSDGPCAMAIIPREYPRDRLTEEEAMGMKREIIDWIDEVDEGPRFEGSKYIDGRLEFVCSDHPSKVFLANFLRAKKMWGLKLVEASELVKKHTIIITLAEQDEPQKIISRLLKQNRPLSTDKWKFISLKKEGPCYYLVIGVEDDTMRLLEQWNWMLCYCTAKVPVKLLDDVPARPTHY